MLEAPTATRLGVAKTVPLLIEVVEVGELYHSTVAGYWLKAVKVAVLPVHTFVMLLVMLSGLHGGI